MAVHDVRENSFLCKQTQSVDHVQEDSTRTYLSFKPTNICNIRTTGGSKDVVKPLSQYFFIMDCMLGLNYNKPCNMIIIK